MLSHTPAAFVRTIAKSRIIELNIYGEYTFFRTRPQHNRMCWLDERALLPIAYLFMYWSNSAINSYLINSDDWLILNRLWWAGELENCVK